ncbi:hypothetical protein PCASD_10780 [Puccinia coronata f. sp. avenae]|uniref:Uncharacterized protein n=1 Tax=Puccinia coronata f. sp. avenae TaxID=200324 RepID=A0A2N5ULA4_9BASI|nr:hypothetical protein PCASD_10780 [Puccinia coronata f. sp. avenae]
MGNASPPCCISQLVIPMYDCPEDETGTCLELEVNGSMSLPTERTPDPSSTWLKVGSMEHIRKEDTTWNDVKFFPFSHLAPALEDMRGTAAICGGNKIWMIKMDPAQDKCHLIHEVIDKSNTVTGGRTEVFHTISWSVDPVSLQPILAAAGIRGVVKIFHGRTATELGMMYGHGGTILALAFSLTHPHILATASVDYTIRIWNTSLLLKPSHTRPDPKSQPLLPNWDNPPGQLVTILAGVGGHTAPVCSLAWHSVHPLLATGGMDNHVKVWYLPMLPGFPANSPLQDTRLPESLQTVDPHPPETSQPAPITSLPIFNSKHVHSHWVDQIIWAGRLTPVIVSKSSIICKQSRHPFASYASEQDLEPATSVCVWQPSVLEDMFVDQSGSSEPQEHEANLGGVDFEIEASFKVRKLGLDEERESVEWGLGMCLAQTQLEGSGRLDLALLVANHPDGIAEFPLNSRQSSPPSAAAPAVILHPSSPRKDQPNGEEGQGIFRAIDATPTVLGNKPAFLIRVGQNTAIELWRREFPPRTYQ